MGQQSDPVKRIGIPAKKFQGTQLETKNAARFYLFTTQAPSLPIAVKWWIATVAKTTANGSLL